MKYKHKRSIFENFFIKGKHDYIDDTYTIGKHDKLIILRRED